MMRFSVLPPPSLEEMKLGYSRTGLPSLGYTFDSAMESAMFSKVIKDIVYASRTRPAKKKQGQPAPDQLALI